MAVEIVVGEPFITKTVIEGLLIISRPVYPDNRGSFQEMWRADDISKILDREVVLRQCNLSISYPRVIRGLHAEPQDKIVSPLTGKMRAVIIDIRKESETFKKIEIIDFDNSELIGQRKALFIPTGLANSICVLGDEPVMYVYAVSSNFDPNAKKRAIRWNDPSLKIDWGVTSPIVSEADKNQPLFEEVFKEDE